MRGAILFVGGMAAGAALLYVVLWSGGVLSPYLETVRAEARTAAPAAASPAPLPPDPPPPRRLPQVILPIGNLRPGDIQDTFEQSRGEGRPHEAIDIMAPRGAPVRAMVDGEIKKLFDSKLGGLTIYQFDRKEELCYYYAHLDRYAEGIKEGMQVARGTVIGFVGSTGNAHPDAPHLHLAIFRLGPEKQWWKGTAINPYPILMEALREPF